MKLMCKATGCWYDNFGCCGRCKTHIYEGLIEPENSWLAPLYRLKWKWEQNKWRNKHKCEVCGKAMFFTDEFTCSDACLDKWLPF